MGFTREIIASPAKLEQELAELEPLERAEERAQLAAGVKAAKLLLETVSGREKVQVTIQGHSDPEAEGFNPRMALVSISRLDPEALERAELEAAQAAEQARDREQAIAERQAEADAALERARENGADVERIEELAAEAGVDPGEAVRSVGSADAAGS